MSKNIFLDYKKNNDSFPIMSIFENKMLYYLVQTGKQSFIFAYLLIEILMVANESIYNNKNYNFCITHFFSEILHLHYHCKLKVKGMMKSCVQNVYSWLSTCLALIVRIHKMQLIKRGEEDVPLYKTNAGT